MIAVENSIKIAIEIAIEIATETAIKAAIEIAIERLGLPCTPMRQALDPASYAADSGVEVLAGDEESLLVRGYGSYHAGWPTGW